MTDAFTTAKIVCAQIEDGRDIEYIFNYAKGEMKELKEEIVKLQNKQPAGSDGIIGEAVDVIACMLDIIFKANPQITRDQFESLVSKKLYKWKGNYHASRS